MEVILENLINRKKAHRDAKRKAKAFLRLNVVTEVKDNKKGFFKYVNSRSKM